MLSTLLKKSIASATEITKELWKELYLNESFEGWEPTSLKEFLETGKTTHKLFNCPVLSFLAKGDIESVLLVRPDGILLERYFYKPLKNIKRSIPSNGSLMYSLGIIVEGVGKNPLTCIKNGDILDEVTETHALSDIIEEPTLSFMCLGRFFIGGSNQNNLAKSGVNALLKGSILDYTSDATMKVSAKDLKTIARKKKGHVDFVSIQLLNSWVTPPKPGFVLLSEENHKYTWHKAGSVLVSHGNMTILVGVDDDMYFGCELVGKPKTLKAAYLGLVPKKAQGKKTQRQGEWFAVPCPKNKIPKIKDCLIRNDLNEEVGLPVEDTEAATHSVMSRDIRVTKNGFFAEDPTVVHSEKDHPQMKLKGWHEFVKNTAKRSFSQEGVD